MKAIIAKSAGGPEVLESAELDRPEPGPGEVLVRIVATGVNPVDTKIRAAMMELAPESGVLGCDLAGVVEAAGADAADFVPGDHVFGCAAGVRPLGGALAEYAACDARLLAHKPDALDFRQAAALPLVGITAWQAIVERGRTTAGDHVLIHGGAGGVGHAAIQIAKAHGARVAATVSSSEKAQIARSFGADDIVNYRQEGVALYRDRLTGGCGFDLVLDASGGGEIVDSFKAARDEGRVVTTVARYEADLSEMHSRALSLDVVFMLLMMRHEERRARQGKITRALAGLARAGALRPLIDERRFTLDRAADAHRLQESGEAVGKIVIDVADA